MKLSKYIIHGAYITYYRDGDDYLPNHSQKGTTQLVISLNEPNGNRIFKVGQKEYPIGHGDTILFGSSSHGIAKELNKKGRMSITLFMTYDAQLKADLGYI